VDMKSSIFWDIHREVRRKSTDILDEHVASPFLLPVSRLFLVYVILRP
jgi:hypothetical protein